MSESESDPTESAPTEPAPSSPTIGSRVRQSLLALALMATASLVVTGFVLFRERDTRQQFEAAAEAVAAKCETKIETLRGERDEARRGASRLHAFLDVVMAREELARGNFGNARARMEAAASHLEAGGDADLAKQARAVDIQITQDQEATREALVAIETAVEGLVDHPAPAAD